MRRLIGSISLFVISFWLPAAAHGSEASEPVRSAPATRFESVDRLLEKHVERRQVAGAVALVMQKGKVIYSTAVGMQDRETESPMRSDTIFRIASMTKPVTSVAVMMLRDEGRLDLDDPVSKFLPEFADPQVLEVDSTGGQRLVEARREITIRDLLTHTSGLSYGFLSPPPLRERYAAVRVSDGLVETPGTIADNTRRLAKVPLANQPGEAWQYGLSTDVLGRVVEVVSGKTLDRFFRERIFEPLGMRDTHFVLPEDKTSRLAALYRPAEDGTIECVGKGPQAAGGVTYSATYPYASAGTYFSGGAGLVSTAADYAHFPQMLLNGGELEGVRLLKPVTVAEMTRNQIGDLNILFSVHGDKFGLGFGVHSPRSEERNGASVGTYSWGGIFHTYFWVDPDQELIGILMTQLYPFDHLSLWADFQQQVYTALESETDQQGLLGPQPGEVYSLHRGRPHQDRPASPALVVRSDE